MRSTLLGVRDSAWRPRSCLRTTHERSLPQDPTACLGTEPVTVPTFPPEIRLYWLAWRARCLLVNVPPMSDLRDSFGHDEALDPRTGQMLLRKEVIQPHLPVRLPCYDFVPIASPTFDGSLHKG